MPKVTQPNNIRVKMPKFNSHITAPGSFYNPTIKKPSSTSIAGTSMQFFPFILVCLSLSFHGLRTEELTEVWKVLRVLYQCTSVLDHGKSSGVSMVMYYLIMCNLSQYIA